MSFFAAGLVALFFVFAVPAGRPVVLPELCDNAQDDDQDGLTDLNDPDCDCLGRDSRLVNHSFENINCCPDGPGQAFCITAWLEATLSTPDYLNQCGWMGWDHLPVPLPIPDGQACVGFRNGRFQSSSLPEEKEYIGACMNVDPLWAGETYHLRSHVGFTNPENSPPTNLVFYGSADCDQLPAGLGRNDLGCPANAPEWYVVKSIPISGANSWKAYEFTLRPEETIFALAIGPECKNASSDADLYYFFDNLIIAEESSFFFEIKESGAPCSEAFALEVPFADTLTYQWYRDGIALVGETRHRLLPGAVDGAYRAAVFSAGNCALSEPYDHRAATPSSELSAVFCAGETYAFNGRRIAEAGVYRDTLSTAEGCDSIVQLTLEMAVPEVDSMEVKIFEGGSFRFGGRAYRQAGSYLGRIPRDQGCDSLLFFTLGFFDVFAPSAFSPNGDGINDAFTIYGGPELKEISSLLVFDRWGGTVFAGRQLPPGDEAAGWDGRSAAAGVYLYKASLGMEDGSTWSRSGSVLLLR